jgi:ferredoxin--NADP+ reductase
MKAYELTSNEEISPGVHVVSFNRDFEFIPGQVVKISLSPGKAAYLQYLQRE